MNSAVRHLQDRVARLLGSSPEERTEVFRGMLSQRRHDRVGYWLQLLMAAVLATLGLALDSTAVVIGAMLIAPLMRPIVELAMGLATGSAPLVFRAGLRTVASLVVVTATSVTLTWLLPFHEATRELLARTAPSLLDLFVAGACAVAGAYATVIRNSDVATTAAGTSIGISLVPPLCTSGYGLATGNWEMAEGAALLFTANVTGIVTVAGLIFVLVGYAQVDTRTEAHNLDPSEVGMAARIGRRIAATRLRVLGRVMFPLLLLAAISVPLVRAVHDMSRSSAVRREIEEMLGRSGTTRVVQYHLDQTVRPTVLRVVLLGTSTDAHALERSLRERLRSVGERRARIFVWAVPDASAFTDLSQRLDDLPPPAPIVTPPPPPPSLEQRIRNAWPQGRAVLAIWTSEGPPPRVRITHLGAALDETARELLAKAANEPALVVEEVALSAVVAPDAKTWLPAARELADHARGIVTLCATTPASTKRESTETKQARAWLATMPDVGVATGTDWSLAPCTR